MNSTTGSGFDLKLARRPSRDAHFDRGVFQVRFCLPRLCLPRRSHAKAGAFRFGGAFRERFRSG